MENNRFHRTPFTAQGGEIFCASGFSVAVVASPELAAFVVRACNRYDLLMAAFDLCRGHFDNLTLPHSFPNDKAFGDISRELQTHIQQHGR